VHPGPAEVEIAVLEADLLVVVDLVLDREDRRPRLGEDADLAATTSTFPVSRSGFTVSAERRATSPTTATTYSERTRSAAAWAPSETSGRATTWQSPSRSRRSMKMTRRGRGASRPSPSG